MAMSSGTPESSNSVQPIKEQHPIWKLVSILTVMLVTATVVFVLIVTAPHYCINTWAPWASSDPKQSRNAGAILDSPEITTVGTSSIDPCEKAFIEANLKDYAKRIEFLCSAVSRAKKNFRALRDEQSCHYYVVQIAVLILGTLATIFVASRDTNEALARLAIIPTALVTLMTGVGSLYGFQDRFLGSAGVANAVAAIEGQLEFALLSYADKKPEDRGKLNEDLDAWQAKLADTLSGNFSNILKAMGQSSQSGQ